MLRRDCFCLFFVIGFAQSVRVEALASARGSGSGNEMPVVVPIRTIQENRATYVGQVVTVEGQPFWSPTVIQDESGRGLELLRASPNPFLQDPSNRVQLRGRVGRSGKRLVLETLEFLSLVSTGNPPIPPLVVRVADTADSLLSGTFIQVTGRVDSFGWRAFGVRDGSGRVSVAVPSDGWSFHLGEYVTARGVPRHDLLVRNNLEFFAHGDVVVPVSRASVGQNVEVTLHLARNAWTVSTFGLRLVYDPTMLRFVGGSCCGVASTWSGCEIGVAGMDTVVVQASNSVPVAPQSDVDLVCISFETLDCGPSALRLDSLTGDLFQLTPVDGRFECLGCVSDGDVNGDGALSPADALCAFETFLNNGHPSANCADFGECGPARGNVNCDAQVLPSDALAIFSRWLNAYGGPLACFAQSRSTAASSYRFDPVRAVRTGADTLAIPLERQARSGDAAFAVRIEFDPSAEFVEMRLAPGATAWPGFGARLIAPGCVLAGGFGAGLAGAKPGDPATLDWSPLGELVFRTGASSSVVHRVEWLEAITAEHAVTEPIAGRYGIAIGTPRPNPARSDVALDVSVPPGNLTPFEIRVLDVRGRLVRRLHSGPLTGGLQVVRWDRRNMRNEAVAAGVYMVQVRVQDRVEKRKIVVLR